MICDRTRRRQVMNHPNQPMTCMVFAGTTEGRELAEKMAGKACVLHVYVATAYGAELLPKEENIRIHTGRLDQQMLEKEIAALVPELVIDATHPYAAVVTENIRMACSAAGISYLRVADRKTLQDEDVHTVSSMKEAVAFLERTEGNILFTTGSKEIGETAGMRDLKERVYARVLPAVASLNLCGEAGIPASHIIAMQGPFSEKMNELQMREKQIRWLVTKDSGEEGGCPEKCEAAKAVGAGIVMIGRPEEDRNAVSVEEAIIRLETFDCTSDQQSKNRTSDQQPTERASLTGNTVKTDHPGSPADSERILSPADSGSADMEPGTDKESFAEPDCILSLVGLGPGGLGQLTLEAVDAIQRADVLFGASRMLEQGLAIHADCPAVKAYQAKEIIAYLEEHPEFHSAAVLYSGDISFCSGARGFRDMEFTTERAYRVRTVSGISSVSYLLGKLGIPREETHVLSIHGKTIPVVPTVRARRYTAVLVGKETDAGEIASVLTELGMEDVLITVGEKLSFPEERITTWTAEDLAGRKTEKLAVLVFDNSNPVKVPAGFGLSDAAFLRGKVPMTKRDVRVASLSRMHLSDHACVWDVGAGTGSVSVEAALHVPFGFVYAIEKKEEALALIRENRNRFGCGNLVPVAGSAPEVLRELPAPDAVFIGGSSGKLVEILSVVFAKNPCADVVINAVSAETATEIYELRRALEAGVPDQEITLTEISVVGEQRAGSYHLRRAESPILICEIHRRTT